MSDFLYDEEVASTDDLTDQISYFEDFFQNFIQTLPPKFSESNEFVQENPSADDVELDRILNEAINATSCDNFSEGCFIDRAAEIEHVTFELQAMLEESIARDAEIVDQSQIKIDKTEEMVLDSIEVLATFKVKELDQPEQIHELINDDENINMNTGSVLSSELPREMLPESTVKTKRKKRRSQTTMCKVCRKFFKNVLIHNIRVHDQRPKPKRKYHR